MPGMGPQAALLAVLAWVRELAELSATWCGRQRTCTWGRQNTFRLERGGHCVQVNGMGGRTTCSVSIDGPSQTQQGQLRPSEQILKPAVVELVRAGLTRGLDLLRYQ